MHGENNDMGICKSVLPYMGRCQIEFTVVHWQVCSVGDYLRSLQDCSYSMSVHYEEYEGTLMYK